MLLQVIHHCLKVVGGVVDKRNRIAPVRERLAIAVDGTAAAGRVSHRAVVLDAGVAIAAGKDHDVGCGRVRMDVEDALQSTVVGNIDHGRGHGPHGRGRDHCNGQERTRAQGIHECSWCPQESIAVST